MLKLLLGASGTGKTQVILDEIATRMDEGKKSFLLVPDQQSLYAEHFFASKLPSTAPRFFEVTTFKHLANILTKEFRGYTTEHITPIAEGVLMWRTVSELQSQIKTSKAKPTLNAVSRMISIENELHSLKLDAAKLELASRRIEEPTLKDKLGDYALITRTYRSLIEEHYGSHASELDELTSLLKEKKPIESYKVFLDDFNGFTEEEMGVISALLLTCDVEISLLIPTNEDMQLSTADVLETKTKLLKLATNLDIPYEIKKLEENKRQKDETLLFLEENIFRADISKIERLDHASDGISIVSTQDPYDAADFIASDIARLTKIEKKARYRDFIIVCNSSESYKGILDSSLAKCGIPSFFSYKNGIDAFEPIKSILCAYSIINSGWKRDDVITYTKTKFSSISEKASDFMEIYSKTWNIHGKRWYEEKPWTNNPDGYAAPHSDSRRKRNEYLLSDLNAAREKFIPQLRKLELATKDTITVNEHIHALTEFLLEMNLPKQIDFYVEEYKKEGDFELSDSYSKLWNVLCDVMDTLSELAGDIKLQRAAFINLFKIAISCVSIGHIPPSLDCVTIGEMNTIREGAVPYVYIIGANEGELPVPPGLGEAFTENERLTLQKEEYACDSKLDVNVSRSYAAFQRCMALANTKLTVLFSENSTKFESMNPSDAVLRMLMLLPENYQVLKLDEAEMFERIVSPAMAIERLGRCTNPDKRKILQDILSKKEEYAWVKDWSFDTLSIANSELSISKENSEKIYHDDLALTQSQIEKYNSCPFNYFCNYILNLREPQQAFLGTSDIGSFMHSLFEEFFKKIDSMGRDIRSFTKAELKAEVNVLFEIILERDFTSKNELTPKILYQLRRIKNRAFEILWDICKEFKSSKFNPNFFELKIDKNNPNMPDPFTYELKSGKKLYIYGTIDRVDTYTEDGKTYIRVLDYKTGKKEFKEETMFEKADFQLFLYLFSLWRTNSKQFKESIGANENSIILPAAVLYLPDLAKNADGGYISLSEAEEEVEVVRNRSGVVLDDLDLIHKMDSSEKLDYLPIKLKKDNTPDSNSMSRLWSLDKFEELIPRVGEKLIELAENMTTGSFIAKPNFKKYADSPCRYCPYKSICRQTKIEK